MSRDLPSMPLKRTAIAVRCPVASVPALQLAVLCRGSYIVLYLTICADALVDAASFRCTMYPPGPPVVYRGPMYVMLMLVGTMLAS